jgi:hypothetical protein
MLLGSCVGGTFAAYLQSTTFPHKSLNTSKWVLFSGIAWILSSGLIQLITLTNELKYFIPNVFVLAIWNLFLILSGGPILGLLTGIALKYPAKIPQQ